MAISIWKHALSPGTFTVTDPDTGEPRAVTFSAGDLRQFDASTNAMLADGYAPPVPLEHQDDAAPVSKADRRARTVSHNTGFVGASRYFPDRQEWWLRLDVDGVPGVPPEETEDFLKNRVRFISPDLHPQMVLGSGRRYDHALRHCALTATPIFTAQHRFGTPAPMSFRAVPRGLRLSMADRVTDPRSTPMSDFEGLKHLPGLLDKIEEALREARQILGDNVGVRKARPEPENVALSQPGAGQGGWAEADRAAREEAAGDELIRLAGVKPKK